MWEVEKRRAMVVLTRAQWEELILRLEDGCDRPALIDSLLNQGYSLLEAEAIANKAQASYDLEKRREALRRRTFRHRLNRPAVNIFVLAILAGVLIPLIYFETSVKEFTYSWGFPWMFYVFGNWVSCLASGNLPGGFSDDGGMMVASCKYLGTATPFQQAVAGLGGFFFCLLVGVFLVIFMIVHASKTHRDKEMGSGDKRWRYISAWFNGAVGFSCITAMTYALKKGVSGEMALDIGSVASVFSLEGSVIIGYLVIVSYIIIGMTVVLVAYHISKDMRTRSLA